MGRTKFSKIIFDFWPSLEKQDKIIKNYEADMFLLGRDFDEEVWSKFFDLIVLFTGYHSHSIVT